MSDNRKAIPQKAWDRVLPHDGHDVEEVVSKSSGLVHIVCHTCKESLWKYQPCEVYSRVCGYLRPVSGYNLGKQAEFEVRGEYDLGEGRSKEGIQNMEG